MNDIHGGAYDNNDQLYYPELYTKFAREHPEYLIGKFKDRLPHYSFDYRGWVGANFAIAEVRDYVFSLFEEVCHNYDIDGLELDFFRHPLGKPGRYLVLRVAFENHLFNPVAVAINHTCNLWFQRSSLGQAAYCFDEFAAKTLLVFGDLLLSFAPLVFAFPVLEFQLDLSQQVVVHHFAGFKTIYWQ